MAQIFEFDTFRVDTEKRLLWRGEELLTLEPKAFEMLAVLLEKRGETISKDELARRVWHDVVATDDSIAQQISRLRKTLGDNPKLHRFIATVPGIGYKFVADARVREDGNHAARENNLAGVVENQSAPNDDSARAGGEHSSEPNFAQGRNFAGLPEQKTLEKNKTRRLRKFSDWRFLSAAAVLTALVGLAAVYYFGLPSARKNALGVGSIAVLPFKLTGADTATENDSLRIGMADALITRLARLEQITILPTSRVSRFDKSEQDSLTAGRELNVDAVLEGRIQKDGERLRVTAQLIRVADGKTLWAENYEENFSGIFDLQSQVARKIAETLEIELTDEQERAWQKRVTSSPEAYRLYLEAYHLKVRRADGEGRALAEKNYQKAIELDPKFALAYVGLASLIVETPSAETYRKARALAEQAVALDDELGEAHAILAFTLWRDGWDYAAAERHYQKAIALNKQHSPGMIYGNYAMLLCGLGRFDDARRMIEELYSLPNKPTVPTWQMAVEFYARDYDVAIRFAAERLDKNPNDINALSFISPAYTEKGMHAQAIETAEKYAALDTLAGAGGLCYLAYAYARAGQTARAREILRQIESRNLSPKEQNFGALAMLYGALGERDRAFTNLEKSVENREWWIFTFKVSPQFDSLRDDPRFAEILRRVNL